ncbi:uncharacterized protein MYCFIDRAFT_170707 [Pseudocercospora fijiensis CIRAD86]|uniref:Uncharacterized protein n=1 Tax=Pseudocercospora fijiensis (strain CIRAD86) TaxID=383855 RepID=N1Q8H9_PSEFD|nr:uncharacterized protein MYCFIDRAFT_170707 [Pseudocercospora fijiensis CIRAD86]EME89195.1 hypothetical protein MYCFIDRAFT_170707 [Pseudocercospora fijiensis CIRAD86]
MQQSVVAVKTAARRAALHTARLPGGYFPTACPCSSPYTTSSATAPATERSKSNIIHEDVRSHRDGRAHQANPERIDRRAVGSSREKRKDLKHRAVDGSKLEDGNAEGVIENSAPKTIPGTRQPFSKHAGKVFPNTSVDVAGGAPDGGKRSQRTNIPIMRGQYSIMSHMYEPFPKPINVTTFLQTKIFASDQYNPKSIEIRRRFKAFDPKSFIWVVRCPVSVSKKSTYRHLVEKKVRRAFRAALENEGYSDDGNLLAKGQGHSEEAPNVYDQAERRGRLSGALLITLSKDAHKTLTAKGKEIRENVELLLKKVLVQRETASSLQARGCIAVNAFKKCSKLTFDAPFPRSDLAHVIKSVVDLEEELPTGPRQRPKLIARACTVMQAIHFRALWLAPGAGLGKPYEESLRMSIFDLHSQKALPPMHSDCSHQTDSACPYMWVASPSQRRSFNSHPLTLTISASTP